MIKMNHNFEYVLEDLDLTMMKHMKTYQVRQNVGLMVTMQVLLDYMIKLEPTNVMTFPVTSIIDLGHMADNLNFRDIRTNITGLGHHSRIFFYRCFSCFSHEKHGQSPYYQRR